jgi:hypothetical protein
MLIMGWVTDLIARLRVVMLGGGERRRAVGDRRPGPGWSAGSGPDDPPPVIDAKALFAATVRASADMEMDWMWLYAQMTGHFERLYCLEKALVLDPQNQAARGELARLLGR